ncbi:MAG: SPOR domain-containing protein [Blastocatellia bacterium]
MQLTATEATCPLCKQPVSGGGGHSDPTRLCEDCRRMVHAIRSTKSTSLAVMDSPQARSMPQPPLAIPLQNELQISDEVVARRTRSSHESATQVGEPDLLALDPLAGFDRDPFDFDELFKDVSFSTSHVPASPRHSTEASGECDLQVSPAIGETMREAAPQPQCTTAMPAELAEESSAMAAVNAATPISPAELNESDPVSDCRIGFTIDGPPVRPFLRHEVVTDPLEAPVQHRDHSQEDLPLSVPRIRLSKIARLKLPVAAALVVCCGIAGYFLMYRPSIQASQTSQAVTEQTSAPVTGRQAVPQPLSPAPGAGSEAKESQGLQIENENSEVRYSLQAAAFPNKAGADEFCERLKRAGVPAYVASAEIAGRGRWFRVRVGRFETAQDADRFASESRRRARAVGLNLQLIVSSYDKP